jgi:hypothetical protein
MFSGYANVTTYPDTVVTMNMDAAKLYVSDEDYGRLAGTSRERAIYLMTAHLFFLNDLIGSGQVPGMVTGSSIDKISVSLTPPPVRNQLHWWLGLTPYGQQLISLLTIRSMGGFYVGGFPERSNFRRMDGSFE